MFFQRRGVFIFFIHIFVTLLRYVIRYSHQMPDFSLKMHQIQFIQFHSAPQIL